MKQKLLKMVQVTVQSFCILIKSEKWSSYGPKTLILTNFCKEMHVFWPSTTFILQISLKYKKCVTVTWTIANNLCFILLPCRWLSFFSLSNDAAYFKSRIIIRWNIKCTMIYFSLFWKRGWWTEANVNYSWPVLRSLLHFILKKYLLFKFIVMSFLMIEKTRDKIIYCLN